MVAANNPYTIDFSPVSNALARWQQQNQFERQAGMQDRQFAEGQRQFNASNALAQQHFGLAQQAADRADDKSPYELKLLQAQIGHMQSMGASEAEMRPYKIAHSIAQTKLAEAQAKAAGTKDVMSEAIAGMIKGAIPEQPGAPPPPQHQYNPGIRPQSFDGGQPMQPQTNALAPAMPSYDPGIIPTAGPNGQPAMPQQQAQADMVDTPAGRMPIENARRMGFALALGGKGDAGKLLTEAANADKIGKTAQGEVEKDMVGLTGTIGRLESIQKRFDPKFLDISNRAGMAWSSLADKFGTLPEDQKADLARYTQFRQQSVNNAALYVKYLSGVAVSEQEFARIMKTLPNSGSGIFDGDSPTEFQAKMATSIRESKMAFARANYLRTQGFKGKPWEAGVAMDDMPDIIDKRGAQIEQEGRQRGIPADRIGPYVEQGLKREFGI